MPRSARPGSHSYQNDEESQRAGWIDLLRAAPAAPLSPRRQATPRDARIEIEPSILGQPPTDSASHVETNDDEVHAQSDDEILRSVYAPALRALSGGVRVDPESIIMDAKLDVDGLENVSLEGEF